MKSVEQNLLSKLAKVKEYLGTTVLQKADYQDLIAKIDDIANEFGKSQPKIKLISDDLTLLSRLKDISNQDLGLNQYYQFHLVLPDSLVENSIQDCELIFLIYQLHSKISAKDIQVIEAAIAKNKYLKVILVSPENKLIEPHSAINHWLEIQNYHLNSNFLWSDDTLLILDDLDSLQYYKSYFEQKISFAKAKLQARFSIQITRLITQQIEKQNKETWKAIRDQKNKWLEGNPPEVFRQKLNQLVFQVNKLQQRRFLQIRQAINHNRSHLNNPFQDKNLFWQTQKIIQDAEVKLVKFEKQNYLVGMVRVNHSLEPLHLYLLQIYQKKAQEIIQHQWKKCKHSYGEGGLKQLEQDILAKLKIVACLDKQELNIFTLQHPNFDFNNLVYLPILAESSKIPFEYSFYQSQWFKILVAGFVGMAIFLVTLLFTGQGRFFGFFILIFQFINLFTGQDMKSLKIKRQTKELKRKLNNKYQMLIRLLTDKITQDLIATLDNEQQYYQQQIDVFSQAANEQVSTVKEQIEGQKEQINALKQGLQSILLLLQ